MKTSRFTEEQIMAIEPEAGAVTADVCSKRGINVRASPSSKRSTRAARKAEDAGGRDRKLNEHIR
jgi:hypothetical protein